VWKLTGIYSFGMKYNVCRRQDHCLRTRLFICSFMCYMYSIRSPLVYNRGLPGDLDLAGPRLDQVLAGPGLLLWTRCCLDGHLRGSCGPESPPAGFPSTRHTSEVVSLTSPRPMTTHPVLPPRGMQRRPSRSPQAPCAEGCACGPG
jgi:hypothetical protein